MYKSNKIFSRESFVHEQKIRTAINTATTKKY